MAYLFPNVFLNKNLAPKFSFDRCTKQRLMCVTRDRTLVTPEAKFHVSTQNVLVAFLFKTRQNCKTITPQPSPQSFSRAVCLRGAVDVPLFVLLL